MVWIYDQWQAGERGDLERIVRRVALALFFCAESALAASDGDGWTLRVDGYGPLRYGMSVKQVRRILGDLGKVPDNETNCPYFRPRARPELDLVFTEDGRLAYAGDRSDHPGIRTVNGIVQGDPAATLERRFPGRVRQDFGNYDLPSEAGATSYVADVLNGVFKWRFYVEDGKVSHISSGYLFAEDLCAD